MKRIDILLAEDNPGDIELAREALNGHKLRNNLFVVEDGEKALEFLRKQGEYKDVPLPDLILLDLNLPKVDGREVLAEIKQDPGLKRIPVVVLTSSQAEKDIIESYDLHANCYITKPLDFEHFIQVVESIESFWLSIVKLPPTTQ